MGEWRLVSLVVLASLACVGCRGQAASPPFREAFTTLQLMEGPIAHAAEHYWDSVQTVVNETGVHEYAPKNDEEWEQVWASAITIAESGNLLMMPSHARDEGDWMRFASQLVDAGIEAARAAEARDRQRVLDTGGRVYAVCARCHRKYLENEE